MKRAISIALALAFAAGCSFIRRLPGSAFPPGTFTPTPTATPSATPCPDGSIPAGHVNTCAPTPEPTVAPTPEPTATPAPTPTPVATATPRPSGTPTSCPCLVVATVAFLGVNDGPPPHLEVGGDAVLDVTARWATSPGDGRGQPCDKGACDGRNCEVASDPVDWSITVPGGVDEHFVNDGYGLRLSNLQAGGYHVRVRPRAGAINQEGERVVSCPWPPGSSVRDSISFEVR